jgi:hypothetical protein
MSIYKFPGSAIEANTITTTQMDSNTWNQVYTALSTANTAYNQANAAFAQANTGGGTAGGFRQSFLMGGF